ncbi:MAG: NlpC/P60 family protein [Sedimenticola sp.]|nr:NlpC/P60 family protein [Sedimenticola sp.]
MIRHITLALLVALLAACTTTERRTPHSPIRQADTTTLNSGEHDLLDTLYQQHQEWQGTPYQLGGQSKRGIDCSGFVQLTYQDKLGVALPRTTEQQARSGLNVNQRELITGDLVFFRINGYTRHVGIYLDNDRFLHASKSQGVMISELGNPYWQSAYWKSKRIL